MANPKSSGGNKSKGKGHQHRQSQQNSHQQQPQQTQMQTQLTPAPVAATNLNPPTATPLASHPSEDTLALAAAVAASIPAAPLARPLPDRRTTTPTVVTPTGNSSSETRNAAENLATSRTASAAVGASENRRGILQRLFGWGS
ncbi:uncharacterized protein LOC6740597 [Drosophila simulans]|uniref:GD18737 n=1 Tax=Drosophila simulans TaxID=7240 RepID=B4NVL1_DROSI|nr:uncharacterized protein LOC6740597 [Drosophila simulans]XP_016037605.1 uncharacterized protein LOC6740597 [Drosophila simulans]EDX16101.1 GD18737 [Drosophila simulans]KMZ07575.1 uncharacterized protein Dsimw501_GD18737, isoform B [Drosophila simulans]KMZ07576.1 uncharacterized protein Dsimw501_GD18737, isoform C [Drosophila simulans]